MRKKCGSCHLKEGWDCEYDDCKGCPTGGVMNNMMNIDRTC